MVTIPSFTWGTIDTGAAAAPTGGAYYYGRRKRFIAYILSCLVWVLIG